MLLFCGRIKVEVTGSLGVQRYLFFVPLSSEVCTVAVGIVHRLRETKAEHVGEDNLNVEAIKEIAGDVEA